MSAYKVLVVDDSRTIRTYLQNVLSRAGYTVILAENGKQALEQMSCRPDLIILDVLMPEMDGYAFCEELRGLGDRYDQLPIVFLTAVQSHAMKLLGREYGAYLSKPVRDQELLAEIQRQLELSGLLPNRICGARQP